MDSMNINENFIYSHNALSYIFEWVTWVTLTQPCPTHLTWGIFGSIH
jgi:hypothetical protein